MEIKSDKEDKKNPNAFRKAWNYITEDIWRILLLIVFPISIYTWVVVFPNDYIWLILSTVGTVFGIVGLLTDGKLFSDIKTMLFVYFTALITITVLWYADSKRNRSRYNRFKALY